MGNIERNLIEEFNDLLGKDKKYSFEEHKLIGVLSRKNISDEKRNQVKKNFFNVIAHHGTVNSEIDMIVRKGYQQFSSDI